MKKLVKKTGTFDFKKSFGCVGNTAISLELWRNKWKTVSSTSYDLDINVSTRTNGDSSLKVTIWGIDKIQLDNLIDQLETIKKSLK